MNKYILSKQIKKELKEVKQIINNYLLIYKFNMYYNQFTEIIHIPLFYGTFYELHMRYKP